MIAPSSVHQLARTDAGIRIDDAARYALQEYGTPSTAWMLSGVQRVSAWTSLRVRLAALFARTPERHPAPRRAESRVPSAAGAAHIVAAEHRRHGPSPYHPHGALAETSVRGLLFPVLDADETAEACECHP